MAKQGFVVPAGAGKRSLLDQSFLLQEPFTKAAFRRFPQRGF